MALRSRLKALGRSSVDTCPMAVNRPEDASTEKPRCCCGLDGSVQEFPGGRHLNLGAGVALLVTGGQGGDGLEGAQGAVGGSKWYPVTLEPCSLEK